MLPYLPTNSRNTFKKPTKHLQSLVVTSPWCHGLLKYALTYSISEEIHLLVLEDTVSAILKTRAIVLFFLDPSSYFHQWQGTHLGCDYLV